MPNLLGFVTIFAKMQKFRQNRYYILLYPGLTPEVIIFRSYGAYHHVAVWLLAAMDVLCLQIIELCGIFLLAFVICYYQFHLLYLKICLHTEYLYISKVFSWLLLNFSFLF